MDFVLERLVVTSLIAHWRLLCLNVHRNDDVWFLLFNKLIKTSYPHHKKNIVTVWERILARLSVVIYFSIYANIESSYWTPETNMLYIHYPSI